MTQLDVHIWSDIACPWCYVGKRRFEQAVAGLPPDKTISVEWHAYELDQSAPAVVDTRVPYIDRLARKYGATPAQAQAMVERMVGVAADAGIEMDFENIQPSNTFDAHRLLRLAKERGLSDALEERLFRAYLCEGARMSDHDALLRLAEDVGIEVDDAAAVLGSTDFSDEVRADELQAAKMGVTGVPFFMIGRYGIPGAQEQNVFTQVIEKAFADLSSEPSLDEGAACGPDGC